MAIDIQARKRHVLIDIARRHQRAGSGSSRVLLEERTSYMAWPDLSPILAPIHWAVVGAAATRLYMPERMTRDLETAIRVQDAAAAQERLAVAGLTWQGELSIGGSTWLNRDGLSIDVIEGHEPWWDEAVELAQTNRDAQGLPILPLPYLVLMKFQSGRVQDIADVTRMLGQADGDR